MDTRRNTALFFAASFLEGLCFYAPVATLYRQAAGLTLAQTAQALDIPQGTVVTRQRKALRLLRLELTDGEEAVHS